MLQIMTPFLTAKLAGQFVAVDAAGLLLSTLQVLFLTNASNINISFFHLITLK